MNKKIFVLAIGLITLPLLASAQGEGGIVSITQMAQNVAQVVWLVATIIIVILWVVTGILFLSAQGDPGKLKTAKTALFSAVGGTAIVILAYSAITIISNALFRGV